MLSEKARRALGEALEKRQIVMDPVELVTYEIDAGFDRGTPDAVAFPQSAEDVSRLVRWANDHGIPLIARGAGTGLSGGAVAEQGGIIVEFSRMNRIVQLDERGRSAVVEPGVPNLILDETAKQKGLYFPPDPSSQRASSLGGNVAENAGGPHCFKYGVTTNYVIGLQVVLADGRIVQFGGRALDYPEYGLGGLIVGSEGTLALVTSISVRLVRNPPGVRTMMATFDSVEQAGAAVSAVIATGLVPAAMELMDQKFVRVVEEYAHAGLPTDAGALLIVEVDGYRASLDPQIEQATTILRAQGGHNLQVARDSAEREQIWRARKSAAGAFSRMALAYHLVDITVPRSLLAETIAELYQVSERYELRVSYAMHAGDGNLHPVILISDPNDRHLIDRVHHAAREMIEIAIRKDGSLTGEHGVGIEKRQYLPLMFSHAELSAMWDVKQVFDPHCRLNPGKIFLAPIMKDKPNETTHTCSDPFIPTSVEQAANGLCALSAEGRRVRIGGSPPTDSVWLSTAGLSGIIAYAPDDLYVKVGAGMLLSDLQAFLARDKNQVPLISPWTGSTIGGIVATNLNAPLRMRYGSIRDLVLAMTVVLGDGRVIRAGRPVVKNVAGYDLAKILVGSRGTLGLIVDVTLKLTPLPRARRTLMARFDDIESALACAARVLPLALVASALVLEKNKNGFRLAYTAEGIPEDVDAELHQVELELHTAGAPQLSQVQVPTGTDLWRDLLGASEDNAIILRAGVPPKDLATFLQISAATLGEGTFIADIASGMVYAIAIPDSVNTARSYVNALREPALNLDGYVMVMQAPEAMRQNLDLGTCRPQVLDLMIKLKSRWDPANILDPDQLVPPESRKYRRLP